MSLPGVIMFSVRRAFAAAVTVLVPLAGVPALTSGAAHAATVIPAAQLGVSAETAAGSCWEIKQKRSSAPSGTYWLLTPDMPAPQQFYCDQTTDGGGWVLVGKGREGWATDYLGKGDPAALTTPDLVPMSSVTTQLSSRTVNQLLGGGRVDSLSDGVRIRRATNSTGTSWQEVRMQFANKPDWTWTFGAEHPLSSWKIGSLRGFGGTSNTFGSGSSTNRVDNEVSDTKGWRVGFKFGSSTRGTNSTTTYLWASANNGRYAIPFAQVYLRPQVLSTDSGFKEIPNGGTPASTVPASLRSDALVTPWGVNGLKGSTSTEGNVEVQAFTESKGKMYVGGNFRYVQKDAAGTGRVEQSFLAAFDLSTGEWDSTFRPVLDEQVKALATLPDGTVVAGGNFSRVNGAPATAIVALDPATGATRTSWQLKLENRVTGGVLRVRTLDVSNGFLYLGGAFTHLSGGSSPNRVVYARNAARVAVANGTPATDWQPDLNGSVVDMDASDDGARLYASGYFSTAKGGADAFRAAALLTAPGAALATTTWKPVWSNQKASYQQTIQQVGDRVFVGGAEHALFQFNTASFNRLAGNITKKGGDFQAADTDGELVFASCHCYNWTYTGAYTWENIGSNWDRADAIKWMGVWDAATGQYVPDFTPNLAMRLGSGPWAIKKDSLGRVWAGGDIVDVKTPQGQKFSGGFARFQRNDSTAPGAPVNFRVTAQTASSVTLAWNAVSDPSGVDYVIMRDDRPIAKVAGPATAVTLPHSGTQRYFVRAVDRNGNVGASTQVLSVTPQGAANQAPNAVVKQTVANLGVALDGSSSTDDKGVTSYTWTLGDGSTKTGAKVNHTYAAPGTYTVKLTVSDAEGLTHSATTSVTVDAASSPSTTQIVANGSTWQWYYELTAPSGGDWKSIAYPATGWKSGAGVLGFGAPNVKTNIDNHPDPGNRPITAYFRKTFNVTNASRVDKLEIEALADDGAVVHVNGVEVGRQNMREGAVTHTTFAPTARRTTVAAQNLLTVEVPKNLLVTGTNVIAVESHVNYRKTPDLTFDLKATISTH